MNEIKSGPQLRRQPEGPSIEMWTYDEYGEETEDAKCHANGKLYNRMVHIYYETGDVKEVVDSAFPNQRVAPYVIIQQYTYQYDASENHMLVSNNWNWVSNTVNPIFKRTVNIYDSASHQIQVLLYTTDTVNPTSIIYKVYNGKGKLVETDERKREGNPPELMPFEKNDFWFDDKGRLYDKATYHPKQGLVKDEKTKFDSTGRTITTYSYTGDRVLTGTIVKGIITATGTTQEDTYDADGFLTDYTIEHDSAKHLMDKGIFHITYKRVQGGDGRTHNEEPGDTVMTKHIVNDNHFNVIVEDNFSTEGKPIMQKNFQYSYDNIGNWVARVQFNNEKAVRITEREITYFND